jgi:hypothetical protein
MFRARQSGTFGRALAAILQMIRGGTEWNPWQRLLAFASFLAPARRWRIRNAIAGLAITARRALLDLH